MAQRPDDYRPIVDADDAKQLTGRTLPAGKAIGVVVLSLLIALVLNSGAVVRAAEGMPDGATRTVVLGVAEPVDTLARDLRLDTPRRQLDAALGNETKTARAGGGLADAAAGEDLPALSPGPHGPGSVTSAPVTSTPAPTGPPTVEPPVPAAQRPTAADPLKVLVTGDSLSDFVGQQITNETKRSGLARVTTLPFNGTGLTNPDSFDWSVNARQLVRERRPDVVVVVLGGNDGWNLTVKGRAYYADSAEWQGQYARRVAAVMRILTGDGRRVLWSGPPTASSSKWTRIFARQNRAVSQAAAAVPGAAYVDLFHGTAVHGHYSDYVTIGGQRVLARQPDGTHWTYRGAVQPARLLVAELERQFGPL